MEHDEMEKNNFNNADHSRRIFRGRVSSDAFNNVALLQRASKLFRKIAVGIGFASIAVLSFPLLTQAALYQQLDASSQSTSALSNPGIVINSGITGDFTSLTIKYQNTSGGPSCAGYGLYVLQRDSPIIPGVYAGNVTWYTTSSKSCNSKSGDTWLASDFVNGPPKFDLNKYYAFMFYQLGRAVLGTSTNAFLNSYYSSAITDGSGPLLDTTIADAYFQLITDNSELTASSSIRINIPTSGQSISDFPFWTVSAQTASPNSALKMTYRDDFGGTYTDVLDPNFSTSTPYQHNYPKQNPLHVGLWTASARIVSSSSGAIASSPWISFNITGENPNTYITPPGLGGCSATSSYSVWNLSDWKCVIFSTWSDAIDSVSNTFKAGGNSIKNLIVSTFPISVFYQINQDFASVASTTPTSTAPIMIPGLQSGKTILLVSSSSVNGASAYYGGLNFRDILAKLTWAALGVIMLAQSILMVFLMSRKDE